MAKLILEINDAAIDDICGIECSMKLDVAPESDRTLADAAVLVLSKTMKTLLPVITKALVEEKGNKKVKVTSIHDNQTLTDVMAEHKASQAKPH
jgi:hypothetical protein